MTITVELPDGRKVEFPDGTSQDVMREALTRVPSQSLAQTVEETQPPATTMRAQTMSGVNEGIGGTLGLPVDLMTMGLNAASGGINKMVGTNIPAIENPVLGSQHINSMMQSAGSIDEEAPQTTGQRYARSIGREFGASVIPAGRVAGGVDDLAKLARVEGASIVGGGVGSQAARDIAPDSALAEMVGGLIGGGAPIAMSGRNAPEKGPSMDALRAQQRAAYDTVDNSQAKLVESSRQALVDSILSKNQDEMIDAMLTPKAARMQELIADMPANPSIAQVEKFRRAIGKNVSGSPDRAEQHFGGLMTKEIDDYLAGLKPTDTTGGDATGVIDSLRTGRDTTRRIKNTEMVGDAIERAGRRADSSGTGGNQINATRQNLRSILDSPKKSRGLSQEEKAAMEAIVRGSPATNALRLAGRFSPTAGALPAMAGTASAAGMGPLGAIPSAVGFAAKGGAEMITENQIDALMNQLRAGRPLQGATMSDAQKTVLEQLMFRRATDLGSQTQ